MNWAIFVARETTDWQAPKEVEQAVAQIKRHRAKQEEFSKQLANASTVEARSNVNRLLRRSQIWMALTQAWLDIASNPPPKSDL